MRACAQVKPRGSGESTPTRSATPRHTARARRDAREARAAPGSPKAMGRGGAGGAKPEAPWWSPKELAGKLTFKVPQSVAIRGACERRLCQLAGGQRCHRSRLCYRPGCCSRCRWHLGRADALAT